MSENHAPVKSLFELGNCSRMFAKRWLRLGQDKRTGREGTDFQPHYVIVVNGPEVEIAEINCF